VSLGREALNWDERTWAAIDHAVHEENVRAGVAAKVIPLRGPLPQAVTVPAEAIDPGTLTIDESAVVPLVELTVDFSLTRQQVEQEAELGTAATLAGRAAALLTQAEDFVVLRGDSALKAGLLGGTVSGRGPAGAGLIDAGVETVAANGGGTFEAVAKAFSKLQASSHTGPYGLLLDADNYAAAFEVPKGEIVPSAERLRGLVQALYGTAAMPDGQGVLVSVGGDTVDLVIGSDPNVAFLGLDADDRFGFRVVERFVLRVKDPTACVRLELGGGP
jgi:uncharacterized linocin/CFP29 family protein